MNFLYDFEYFEGENIESKINYLFGDEFDFNSLGIVFSNDYPEKYSLYKSKLADPKEKLQIDGLLGDFDLEQQKIILYLPVIFDYRLFKPIPKQDLIELILYFEIGQLVCSKAKFADRTFTKETFYNTGSIFRNFVGSMITFELIKPYTDTSYFYFDVFHRHLTQDYDLCLTFIENHTYKLNGLELRKLVHFVKTVMAFKLKDITREDICKHFYYYITSNIRRNPKSINILYDVLRKDQKRKYQEVISRYMIDYE